MRASYKKLWKLMIDRDMSKTDLRLAIGASSATVAKLTNGEFVASDVLARICKLFHCDIGDIMTLNVEEERPDDPRRRPSARLSSRTDSLL